MNYNNTHINRIFKRLLADKKLMISVFIIVFFWITIYIIVFYEPKYVSNATIMLSDTSTPTFVTNIDGDASFSNKSNETLTQIEILRSYQLAQYLKKFIQEKYPKELKNNMTDQKFYVILRKHLTAKSKLATDIINISFTWDNPEIAKELLTEILKEYKRVNLSFNRQIQTDKRQYIDEILVQGEKRLNIVRAKIANYMKDNLAISIDEESIRLVNQNINFKTRLEMTNASIQRYSSTINDIKAKLGLNTEDAINAVALGADNKSLALLREKLDDNQQQLAFESIKLAPTNPKIVALKKQIEEVKKQIHEQIILSIGKNTKISNVSIYDPVRTKLVLDLVDAQTEYSSLIAEKGSLEKSLREIVENQSLIPEKKYTLDDLQQEERNLSLAYDEIKKKQIEARIKEAEISSNIIIIDPPDFSKKQSFPTVFHIILLGILFSFVLTIVVSILKTVVEDVCEGVDEIEATTGRKIIGILPWYDDKQAQIDKIKVDELSYENILSNLLIKNYTTNSKVLTFSSNSIKKYNSTVVYKLASKLNQLGHSVVVIDSDLRNPSLYKNAQLDLSYKREFSDLVLEIESKLRKNIKIQKEDILDGLSKDENGLSVLSNLTPVKNSYDYFVGNAFSLIIDTLRENFDWVLIDTPTVVLAPEVFVIAKKSDSFVLITTIKVTYSHLKRIVMDLKEANINFIGSIIRDKNVNVAEYLEFLN